MITRTAPATNYGPQNMRNGEQLFSGTGSHEWSKKNCRRWLPLLLLHIKSRHSKLLWLLAWAASLNWR